MAGSGDERAVAVLAGAGLLDDGCGWDALRRAVEGINYTYARYRAVTARAGASRWQSVDEVIEAWAGLYVATRGFVDQDLRLHCGACGGPWQATACELDGWPAILPHGLLANGPSTVASRTVATAMPAGVPIVERRFTLTCNRKKCSRRWPVTSERLIAAFLKVATERRTLVVGSGAYAVEHGRRDL